MSMCAVRVVLSANFSVTVHTPFALKVNGSAPLPVLFHVVAASPEPSGGVNVTVAALEKSPFQSSPE